MGNGVLIDRKGRVWPDSSSDLARRIGYRDARDDLASFAVRAWGFIHVREHAGQARVALRERRFNFTAFAAAMLVLGRMKPSRIMLSVVGDGPPAFRIFFDLHDFCAEIEPLAAGKPVEIRIPRLSERRNRRVVNLAHFAGVRPIVELWERTRGELAEEVHRAILASGLLHRTILVRQMPQSSRLVTQHFGAGIMIMRPCEALRAVGRDLQDQPDKEYGEWLAEAYAETLWRRRLRVESCRALVRTSTATTLRTRYDRVLMPWHSGNDLFVMCLSIQREVPVALQ